MKEKLVKYGVSIYHEHYPYPFPIIFCGCFFVNIKLDKRDLLLIRILSVFNYLQDRKDNVRIYSYNPEDMYIIYYLNLQEDPLRNMWYYSLLFGNGKFTIMMYFNSFVVKLHLKN